MHTLGIGGFTVEFPFEPYKCQMKFMEKVMEALKTSQNAALESPTGTGKTLCLLCAAIAYIKDCKSKIKQPGVSGELQGTSSGSLYPKVLYASRTHSQLAQVIRELNKTTYKDIKTVTLASRDLLCINDKVMKESNSHVKSLMCRNLINKHRCLFYNMYETADSESLDLLYSENGLVPDIEDVINISKKHRLCPYFRSRTMFENADLILLPYSYIVDPRLRHKHNIHLQGNIVIFDEAHNLESVCEESTSVSLTTTQISGCIRETKKVLEMLLNDDEEIRTEMDNTVSPFGTEILKDKEVKVATNDVAYLLDSLHQLEDVVDGLQKDKGMKVLGIGGRFYSGEKMVELLSRAGFRKDMRESVSLTIDKIGRYLTAKAENGTESEKFVDKGEHLIQFASFISIVYADSHASLRAPGNVSGTAKNTSITGAAGDSAKYFQLYVTEQESVITLNYWCFSPSVAMRYLYSCGVRSVIVTSGTLTPMDSFISSLGINVPVTLENEHAASLDQILGARIRCSELGIDLRGTFHYRSTNQYINGVGDVVLRACQLIPEGVLVFFSSYVIMNSCLKLWKTMKSGLTPIWDKLIAYKEAFVEPKSKVELRAVLVQFRQKVKEGNGAVLFAVCRAKVSEGIDFSDCESRGVIVIGIPYAPTTNPRIELKKQFLEKQRIGVANEELKKYISSDEWYQVDAVRSVNQSIGRVLRHKDDFGVVILVDSRFCSMPLKRFPLWMRDCLENYQSISAFGSKCKEFFEKRCLRVDINNKKLSSTMETTSRIVSARKRNEENSHAPDKDPSFDIDALYSSEAVAAFESSACIEDTLPKRPRCIFEEIEENERINKDNSTDMVEPDPIDTCDMSSPSCSFSEIISRKRKPKLRLKPNTPPSMPNKPSVPCSSTVVPEEKTEEPNSTLSRRSNEDVMISWKKSAVEYKSMLQSIEKPKRAVLQVALTNYATTNDFQSLISTFTTETVPNHLEFFKGLYGYLQAEHRPQFESKCRQLKLL